MRLCLFLVTVLLCLGNPLAATDRKDRPTSYWPEAIEFDEAITTPKKFFGFEVGQRHLDHAKLVAYLKQLAEESPRMQYREYGRTHGGRPLVLLTVSSPENLKRQDMIRRQHRMLAKPEKSKRIDIAGLPAVINMGYGVHGDEASATNCSVLVAHYLAAARGEEIQQWLSDCMILLDPSLNPDGFNRFANWVNAYRGRIPSDDSQHREHNQGWPSGRVNYYWFDLNRDWLPLEHPESRARMQWYHAWKPNVVLDFHEMGTRSSYFFQPGVPNRTNPLTPVRNVELTNRFGAYHAKALDRRKSLYYTQEGFDDFYMGKGSTYPDLHGAVGILFEQASARGHVQKNQDGRLTFHDAIANHFTTSLSSLQATSELREELLEFKRDFYIESIEAARKQKKKAIVFAAEGNPTRLQNFASVLLRHDIQCYWPKKSGKGQGEVDREKLVVPLRQPEYRFLRSLLSRKKNFKENIFYDVSTWTLPLAYNLESSAWKQPLDFEKLTAARMVADQGKVGELDAEAVAFLVPWVDDEATRLLGQLLARDVNVKVSMKPFSCVVSDDEEAVDFERGTLLIPLGIQKQKRKLIAAVLKQGARRGLPVFSAGTGLTPEGSDFGSSQFKTIEKPSIALFVGKGVAQYEAGEMWHCLDTKQMLGVTLLNASNTARADLSAYNTILFPGGSYGQMDEADWAALADRIKSGATAIAIGGACKRVFGNLNGGFGPGYDGNNSDANTSSGNKVQLPFDTLAKTKALKLISGSIFRTKIDLTHPLFFGFSSQHLPVFRNHASFLTPSKNPYSNPGIYDSERPHLSGYCSDENVEKFKTAASVVVRPMGKGRVIQISDNPNFRAFWHGTNRVFMNAIYFGEFTDP